MGITHKHVYHVHCTTDCIYPSNGDYIKTNVSYGGADQTVYYPSNGDYT